MIEQNLNNQTSQEILIDNSTATSNKDSSEETLVFGRSEYAKKDFWNDRFKDAKGFFDWYLEYGELKKYFEKIYPITKDSSILMIGCGNSRLSEEMYEDGYKNITNIDISSIVIEKMKNYYKEKEINIECLEMDATNMTFSDNTFDVVIDKGTLDALLCGKDIEIVKKLIQEMTRVLKVNRELFIISHGNATSRKELFRKAVDITKFEFLYSEQKLSDISQLINIFRSKLKDKPLSHILKDKELLKESILEFTSFKNRDNKTLAQRIIELKKEMNAKKKQVLKEKDLESNPENNQEKEVNKNPIENKESQTKQKEVNLKLGSNENSSSTQNKISERRNDSPLSISENQAKIAYEEEKETKSQKDQEYQPRRQAHCYIYYVKKIA